jgi:hypothetical protein
MQESRSLASSSRTWFSTGIIRVEAELAIS